MSALSGPGSARRCNNTDKPEQEGEEGEDEEQEEEEEGSRQRLAVQTQSASD